MTGEAVDCGAAVESVRTGGFMEAGGWVASTAGAVDEALEVTAGEDPVAVPPLLAAQPIAVRKMRANSLRPGRGMERGMENMVSVVTRVSK